MKVTEGDDGSKYGNGIFNKVGRLFFIMGQMGHADGSSLCLVDKLGAEHG